MKNLMLFALLLAFLTVSCHLEKLAPIIECATPPIAAFSPSSTNCEAPCVQAISNNSQNANSYKWDFGDNTASTEANPNHTYGSAGDFVIRLIAYNNEGCTDTALVTVHVGNGFPAPVAGFSVDLTNNSGLAPCAVKFTDASQNADSYAWDFGDGTTVSTEKNPTHTYSLPDDYSVKLTATGAGGVDEFTRTVTVKPITFIKTFGTGDNEYPASVRQTQDNGYVMIGSNNAGVYQVKADNKGNKVWASDWPTLSNGAGADVLESPNGLHKILFTFNASMGLCEELDNPGAGICNGGFSYPGLGTSTGSAMQYTSDGGIILLGSTVDGNGNNRLYLVKTNAFGTELWHKIYTTGVRYGNSIQQTSDGGYIVTGETVNGQTGAHDFFLLRANDQGEMIWEQTFDIGPGDQGTSVQQTADGGFIMLGTNGLLPSVSPEIVLIRTDNTGQQLWKKIISGPGYSSGASVVVTNDGFVLLGATSGQGAGAEDVYLVKTDTNGAVLWERTFGGTQSDYGVSLQRTSDGGFIILGATLSLGNGLRDFYLIKTDKNGNVL